MPRAPDWPAVRMVRLRPHAILGPNAHPLLRALLRQPFYPLLPEPLPLTQCVAEEDVVAAIRLALLGDAEGAFNLAAEPAVPFRDLLRHRHRHPLPLPFTLARALIHASWRVSGRAGEPAWIDGMRHSLALDCTRARRELGWKPRMSVYDCVQRG